jgi:ankyrin repeat protein
MDHWPTNRLTHQSDYPNEYASHYDGRSWDPYQFKKRIDHELERRKDPKIKPKIHWNPLCPSVNPLPFPRIKPKAVLRPLPDDWMPLQYNSVDQFKCKIPPWKKATDRLEFWKELDRREENGVPPLNYNEDLSVMLHAISDYRLDIVQHLVEERGMNPDNLAWGSLFHEDVMMPIVLAAKLDRRDIVFYLKEVCQVKHHLDIACDAAAENGHYDTVDFLHDSKKCSKLCTFVKGGFIPAVRQYLLNESVSDWHEEDETGFSLLCNAVIYDRFEMVKFLVEWPCYKRGSWAYDQVQEHHYFNSLSVPYARHNSVSSPSKPIDPELVIIYDKFGWMPTGCLATNDELQQKHQHHQDQDISFESLVGRAEPGRLCSRGLAAVHLACRYGREDMVRYFIPCEDAGRLWESKWCDPNALTETKETPLHIAAVFGKLNIVKYLLTVQLVDVNARNQKNRTPLHMAILTQINIDTVEVVRSLLQAGADVNLEDFEGRSPLLSLRRVIGDNGSPIMRMFRKEAAAEILFLFEDEIIRSGLTKGGTKLGEDLIHEGRSKKKTKLTEHH